ncbi:NADP-dependent oxidoreductase [Marinospirillum perlucidum]|uniref:NADP-dependent oxidoreductase n=1 Tax=Marinospirillum perlucidum TaxID=1982602 RepID=UPI000DF2992F|nr:NADP-dependent oxidoreductase [Marinospirillum perlucidum]
MPQNTAIHLVRHLDTTPLGPQLFETRQTPLPTVADGQLLVRQTHMSLDPAMLGWMTSDRNSYIAPVELGEVMRSFGYGEVVESHHPDFQAGDRVQGGFGWQEYALVSASEVNAVDPDLPPEMVLSVLALPGLTATQGLLNIGRPQAGETLVVTGAAGSVGSLVGQLGKARGMKVIGIAGSQEKCDWLTHELGFDAAINYKTEAIGEKLDEVAAEGIDVFFENTGGAAQEEVYYRMNAQGRIVVCGLIADYTAATPAPGPNWMQIIKKRLLIQGFTMPDHLHQTGELLQQLLPHVQKGEIKYRAHVIEGLDAAIDGLQLFLTGENQGKLIVKL